MIGDADLAVLVNHRDAIASLQGYYLRSWEKILRALALGIGKVGATRSKQLLAELRYLIALLNPSGDTFVRRWVREWAKQGMQLGQGTAVAQIRSQASPVDRGDLGPIATGKNFASVTSQASIIGTAEEQLKGVNAQMLAALALAIHRTQFVLAQLPTTQTVQRQLGNDIQEAILTGAGRRLAASMRREGIPEDLIQTYDRLYQGQIFGTGTRAFDLNSKVAEIGSGMITDGHNSGVKIVAQANAVDHVRISNPNRVGPPDVCTVFAGHVFYIGAGQDPLGFPSLSDVPNGGPKFHPNCRHGLQPYVIRLKTPAEIADALAGSKAIPKSFYNVKPYDVTKVVRKMDPQKVNRGARAPRTKEKVA